MTCIPPSARIFGFEPEGLVAHTGKTLMLAELRLLCDASAADADDLRRLALDENILQKGTATNRRETLRRLRELYGLRASQPLYRALRELWTAFPNEQPLLALLCAAARDRALRSTAPFILQTSEGSPVSPGDLQAVIEAAFPDRYSSTVLRSLGQNLASSWRQSGHLAGKMRKVRSRAAAGPGSAVYALWMGHLCGVRGRPLFATLWTRLLDADASRLEALAFAASQMGWMEYRSSGDVTEIGFRRLESLTGAGSADG